MSESEGSLLELVRLQEEIASLREANRNLQRNLSKSKAKNADLVEATYEGARDAMAALGRIAPVKPPKALPKARHSNEQSALWILSDWQGSKVTTSYNSEVMQQRVMRFCDKAAKITSMHRESHPIRHCTIGFGGDMVEGLFNYPTQPFEIDSTIFTQYVTVSRLIVDVVRFALSIYDTVEVVSEYGNHGRIGSVRSVVPRSDNIDRMTYELSRQLLENEHRLTWNPNHGTEDIQRIEIGNYRALLIHGDEVGRGGFSSPMTMVRACNQWASGAYPWAFRDVYMGHYHTHASWSMANGTGTLYQCGSTESDNRYARETMAAAAIPSQRLHFIDPEEGRVTAEYKVWLDKDPIRE